MELVINDYTVQITVSSASRCGFFRLDGKVFSYEGSKPITFIVFQEHDGKSAVCVLEFPQGPHYGTDVGEVLNAAVIADQMIHKYLEMLDFAINNKGEYAHIIRMISTREYDLAKMYIDMTNISLKNLTDKARTALPFSGCESVLDVILKVDDFKPALAVFKKRYGDSGAEQITEAEQPLLELAESVFEAYMAAMLPVEKAPDGVMVMVDVEIKRRKQQEAKLRADFIKLA